LACRRNLKELSYADVKLYEAWFSVRKTTSFLIDVQSAAPAIFVGRGGGGKGQRVT
jgi:hypothetical protein